MADVLIGKRLGDYLVQDLLGRGGMARVYKGLDERLQRFAAVKVISGDMILSDQQEYTERFRREARAIARLSHPNIVGVYQFGEYEGGYYMAMAFIEGKDLRQILRNYDEWKLDLPLADVVNIVKGISSALDYAHGRGVIHRDVKPSNIMLDAENHPVLTDFGLALDANEGTLGDTFGSAHYIAPEQAISSAKAVPQSDIYSLGVCVYEMLTGRVPFDDPSAMAVALKHLNEKPPSPRVANPDLPLAIDAVMQRVMEKDPNRRYANGLQFSQALEAALLSGLTDDAAAPAAAPVSNTRISSSTSLKRIEARKPLPREDEWPDDDDRVTSLDIPDGMPLTATIPPTGAANMAGNGAASNSTQGSQLFRPSQIAPPDPVVKPSNGRRALGLNRNVLIGSLLVTAVIVAGLVAAIGNGQINANGTNDNTPTPVAIALASDDATRTVQTAGTVEATRSSTADSTAASGGATTAVTSTRTERATQAVVTGNSTQSATNAVADNNDNNSGTNTATDTPTRETRLTRTPRATLATTVIAVTIAPETETAGAATQSTSDSTSAGVASAITESSTNTSVPTLRPTSAFTSTPFPPGIDLSLIYNGNQLTVINVSGRIQRIADLVFVQAGSPDKRFAAIEWNTGGAAYSPFSFPTGYCFQVTRVEFGAPAPIEQCSGRLAAYRVVSLSRQFWVLPRTENPAETFDVLLKDQVVAVCRIGDGRCEVDLPDAS